MTKYSKSIIALTLSIVFVFVGLGLVFGYQWDVLWFARFGSLTVLCGVISEYALFKHQQSSLYTALIGQGTTECGNTGIPDLSPEKTHNSLSLISHGVIITGTIIWGFGDEFLKLVSIN